MVTLAAAFVHAVACNGILGDDDKTLDEPCGHDCMAGACAAGKCQPFVLATGQTTPSSLVVEQDVAYWTTGDGTVQSCKRACGRYRHRIGATVGP